MERRKQFPSAGSPDRPSKQYRLYFFGSTGRVESAPYEFVADDDDTACKLCETLREGRRAELWNRTRKVRDWPQG